MVLTQSRTKVDADHAGLSQPPLPWSTLTGELPANLYPFPNKKLFPATLHVTDAMVDGNTKPSNSSRPTDKPPRLTTHIPQELKDKFPHAEPPKNQAVSKLPDTETYKDTASHNLWLPSIPVSSQLPLKLINQSSTTTPVVSLTHPHAEPNLTTPLLPLVMDTMPPQDSTTTSSETPGLPNGENKVTLESPPTPVPVSAVSKWRTPSQPPTD